jgi:acetyl-CoA carboxylase biotin carboxyl carrier protein
MARKARPIVAAKASSSKTEGVVAMARGLAEIVSEHHLTELVIESNGTTITVRREAPMSVPMPAPAHAQIPLAMPMHAPAFVAPAPAAAAAAVGDDKAHVVTSPFVGTFYRKPNPDSPAYVALNDRVDKGAVLCIVEAMKLMNEIEADVSGTVIAILVEDGATVEYGQGLFKIVS